MVFSSGGVDWKCRSCFVRARDEPWDLSARRITRPACSVSDIDDAAITGTISPGKTMQSHETFQDHDLTSTLSEVFSAKTRGSRAKR